MEATVLLFVNKNSGGNKGTIILEKFRKYLGDDHIFDIGEENPANILPSWIGKGGTKRLIVCGGDGTVTWILSILDIIEAPEDEFLVAVMPLGTGNDLSRSLKWGGKFTRAMEEVEFLNAVQQSEIVQLDRWLINVMPDDPDFSAHPNIPLSLTVRQFIHETKEERNMPNLPPKFSRSQSSVILRQGYHRSSMIEPKVGIMGFDHHHKTKKNIQIPDKAEILEFDVEKNVEQKFLREGIIAEKESISSKKEDQEEPKEKSLPTYEATAIRSEDEVIKEIILEIIDHSISSNEDKKQETENSVSCLESGADGNKIHIHHSPLKISEAEHAKPSRASVALHSWLSFDGVFANYFSIGVDAEAALAFHSQRNEHPERFTSPLQNKMNYLRYGYPAAGGLNFRVLGQKLPPSLSTYTEIEYKLRDEDEFTFLEVPSNIKGLIVLNLQSYAGGYNLWGTPKNNASTAPSFGDGKLEVVGVQSITQLGASLGFNGLGVGCYRLCQCSELKLHIDAPEEHRAALQMDGEPWKTESCTVHIKHFNTTPVLSNKIQNNSPSLLNKSLGTLYSTFAKSKPAPSKDIGKPMKTLSNAFGNLKK